MVANTLSLLFVGIAVVAKVLWELYFSPVARQRIPGPKRAAVSDFWHYWVQVRLRRTFTFHELFERYGPVVRVGPNRVIFRNIDTVKTIYSTHRFRKSDWWSSLTFGGAQNMLSTVDPAYHTHCRRLSAPAFRGENLRAAGHVLFQEMEELVTRLRRDCADGAFVDAIQLFPELTLDVLGLAVLGVSFDQIATGKQPEFGEQLKSWMIDKILLSPLPGIVRKLPISRLQQIVAADTAITTYITSLYEKADEKSPEGRANMLETYKAYREADTGEPAPLPLVVSELSLMFVAGTETTATALVYLAYNLAMRKDMRDIMFDELSKTNLHAEDFVETLRGLPYLNAFIREILRVHGSSGTYLERLVPKGGATLDGYFIPEGTQVGGQAYSSHFDEQFFPRSRVVDPLRWVRLDESTGQYINREDLTPAMHANYFPFGIGVRSCAGKALADLELVLITATLVKNFRIHLHGTTTPESMSSIELGVLRPRASRCLLHFEYVPPTKM